MNLLQNITFLNPEYFWGLLLIPIILYFFYKKEKSWISFINLNDTKKIFKKNNYKFYLKIILLWLILVNFIIILSNPHKINISEKIDKDWIDIVIAIDVSRSMQATDLKPNRLEAAKKVVDWFIKNLKTDRVGLVVFAGKPFISIPLTFDYNILSETINRLDTDTINQQKRWLSWTAIWDAILMSKILFTSSIEKAPLNPPLEGKIPREKVIILLTDWDSNIWIDPKIAWTLSWEYWIKIYTIWIWSEKWWYITHQVWLFLQKQKIPPLNYKDLQYISKITDWKFFRADSNTVFEDIFKELQLLEKSEIEVDIKKNYKNLYDVFIYSLILLIMGFWFMIFKNVETLFI